MEQNEKVIAQLTKLRKKSQVYFFGSWLPLVVAAITIPISFIRILWVNGKPLGRHYEIVIPILVVCAILYFIFFRKYKKTSDEFASFFKENIPKK